VCPTDQVHVLPRRQRSLIAKTDHDLSNVELTCVAKKALMTLLP
jgi:hypothetical protein